MDIIKKSILPASKYTGILVIVLSALLALCNPTKENEIFLTIFLFGVGIIFSIFLSAFLIINNLKK